MAFKFEPTDSIDNVPEDFRSLYGEKEDGGYDVRDEFQPAAKAYRDMSLALEKRSKDLRDARGNQVDLSAFAEYGDSPDAIKSAFEDRITELQNELSKGKDAKLNLDKVRQEMNAGFTKKEQAWEQRVQGLTGFLHKTLVTEKAIAEIAQAKGDVDLLMPFIRERTRVSEIEGEFSVYVVDPSGEQRVNHLGNPMSIKELVADMKRDEKFGKLFSSDAPNGGGTPPGSQRRAPAPRSGDGASAVDKIRAGLASGNTKFGSGNVPGLK